MSIIKTTFPLFQTEKDSSITNLLSLVTTDDQSTSHSTTATLDLTTATSHSTTATSHTTNAKSHSTSHSNDATLHSTNASRYDAIAFLDTEENEDEKWSDRTSVITKWQHQEYQDYAGEFLEEILEEVVASAVAPIIEEYR